MPPRAILQIPIFALDIPETQPVQVRNQLDCENYQALLRQLNLPDEFYCIHYLADRTSKTFKLEGKLGFHDIPFHQLIENVHPLLRPWYEAYIEAALRVLPDYAASFLTDRFIIRFPLKGPGVDKFYLVTQSISPFHFDQSGKVASFLSHFHISGGFWWEPLAPEAIGFEPHSSQSILDEIMELVRSWMDLSEKENLTTKQFGVINAIQVLSDAGNTIDDKTIAEQINPLKIGGPTPDTVHRYLNEIRNRLRWLLKTASQETTPESPILKNANALNVINFCKASGILDLLQPDTPPILQPQNPDLDGNNSNI